MNIVSLKNLVDDRDFLHCLVGLNLELCMVETNQLVTQTVYIAAEASLTWQHVFVVVNVLVEEGAIN